MSEDTYRRELSDGLTLRWSTPEDVEPVASLYAHVYRSSPDAPLNWHVPLWTRDMFSGRHPHIGPHDFAVVEDTSTGAIVASTCLLRYPIAFEGIPIPFGRPEVVATQPEYRNRGLIRAIFELIHAKSAARGDLAQGITGIAHYYRQFGYEYSVPMGTGLTVYFAAIPTGRQHAAEPYSLRKATVEDSALLRRLWEREHLQAAISTPLSAEYYRWVIETEAVDQWRLYLIVDVTGRSVGYLRLSPLRWGPAVTVDRDDGRGGLAVGGGCAVCVTRRTGAGRNDDTGETGDTGARRGEVPSLERRPSVARCPKRACPDQPHLSLFCLPRSVVYPRARPRALCHGLTPALERRLASSAQAGYSGELAIDFYRGGLRLALESGKLAVVERWQRPLWGESKIGFPPLLFLQLLFGYRSLHELRSLYPDVWAEGEAAPVLDVLFPKRQSSLIPLD